MADSIRIEGDSGQSKTVIYFPKQFSSLVWVKEFGRVQRICEGKLAGIRNITFDFSNTVWADPGPLLSFLIMLVQIRENSLVIPTVALPYYTPDQNHLPGKGTARILYFLRTHGFLEIIRHYAEVTQHGSPSAISALTIAHSGGTDYLLYQDSFIHEPVILDTSEIMATPQSITGWVHSYLGKCVHRLIKKIPSYNFNDIYNNLSSFLNETILNVYDHAYNTNSAKKLVGVYLRYRDGLNNHSLDSTYRSELNTQLTREQSNCPRLFRQFVDETSAFIEVFVVDAGVGIVESFSNYQYVASSKNPFRRVMDEVIGLGNRNVFKNKRTKFGGLYVLTRIIKKGFIWAIDQSEFFGEQIPVKAKIGDTLSLKEKSIPLKGFLICARITWNVELDNDSIWSNPSVLTGENNIPLLNALGDNRNIYIKYFKKSYRQLKKNNLYIKDNRNFIDESVFPDNYLCNAGSSNYILYLPPEGLSKHDINRIVTTEFNHINNSSVSLIIAEIPSYEAYTYQFALDEANMPEDFSNKFETIVLVTRNLSALVIEKSTFNTVALFKASAENTRQFQANEFVQFHPDKCLSHLVEWLKTHDTLFFWRYILQNKDHPEYFITGEFIWKKANENYTLSSYFNFAETLTNAVCLNIYETCLSRVSKLYDNTYFVGIDNLTENLAAKFNVLATKDDPDKREVLIGSVYVTGITFENATKYNESILLNYFVNQPVSGFQKKNIPHFLLWPDPEFILKHGTKTTENYKRVGSSSVMAPHGWKYFTVPRYKHRNFPRLPILDVILSDDIVAAETDFVSVTECSAPETYKMWQSKNILTIGHYEYENYHDIFKIDVPFAFDESILLTDDLFLFVLTNIICSLGVLPSELLINDIVKLKIEDYIIEKKEDIAEQADMVVYPYHFSSEHIIKKIKSILPGNKANKIISLIPINNNHTNTPYIISPHTEKKLKTIIEDSKKNKPLKTTKALLFDTLKINGKTEREIKHILMLCGIESIKTLTIVDRQRLPIHSFDEKAFCRFDVPILGTKSTCAICKALQKITELKDAFTSDMLENRAQAWKNNWGAVFRYSNNSPNKGIKIIDTTLKNDGKKKFGIYVDREGNDVQIGGDKNQIVLNSSIGLTVYTCEMLSMTTKDDISIDVVSKENLKAEVNIEILATNVLLYDSQISKTTRRRMFKMLFDASKKITVPNNHTILAAIALTLAEDISDREILEWAMTDLTTFLNVSNIDILIFLCTRAHRDPESPLNNVSEIKTLLKKFGDIKADYKEFHSELYNDYGKAHDTALHKIKAEDLITKDILFNANNSLNKLNHLRERFHYSNFSTLTPTMEYESMHELIEGALEELHKKVEKYYYMDDESYDSQRNKIKNELLYNIDFLIESFKAIHSKLYLSFNCQENDKFELRAFINLLKCAFEPNFVISFSKLFNKPILPKGSTTERWIPWNKQIMQVISDVFDNAKYASTVIRDVFNLKNQAESHIWISTQYDDLYCNLIFLNASRLNSKDITAKTKVKFKQSVAYLKKLGGDVFYEDDSEKVTTSGFYVVRTIVKLPFI